MANPSGANQFGGYELQPAYGDVKKQTELTREAPVSGAPVSGRALGTPRRAQRQTQRPRARAAGQGQPVGLVPVAHDITPAATVAQTWADIARIPGASPQVQQLAARAQGA